MWLITPNRDFSCLPVRELAIISSALIVWNSSASFPSGTGWHRCEPPVHGAQDKHLHAVLAERQPRVHTFVHSFHSVLRKHERVNLLCVREESALCHTRARVVITVGAARLDNTPDLQHC